MVDYSLAEIDAVSKKAARGAGFSWGLSEEAGKASRYLASLKMPGPRLLAHYLRQLDSNELVTGIPDPSATPWASESGCLCPLATGALIADLLPTMVPQQSFHLSRSAAPLLMVAIAAGALARDGMAVSFSWNDCRLTCDARGLDLKGDRENLFLPVASQLEVSVLAGVEPMMRPVAEPAHVEESSWHYLNELAFRTYVPASETSRAGAGSDLSDND